MLKDKKRLGDCWIVQEGKDIYWVGYYFIGDGHISVSATFSTRQQAENFCNQL